MKRRTRRILSLAATALPAALFHLLQGQRALMNAIVRVTLPVRQALARLWAWYPGSGMELLAVLGILLLLAWLIRTAVLLRRAKGRRLRCLLGRLYAPAQLCLCAYLLLCLLLGASYRADSFRERSGLSPRPTSVEALEQTTAVFVRRLCETADAVPRDAQGCFAVPPEALLDRAPQIYRSTEERYPFLTLRDCRPKALTFSRLLSRLGYTGVYFPFTGEANINVDVTRAMIPATIAHEMAHQRGVAAEQEANFIAVLACTESGDAAYAYSGWLFGFVHLGGTLYQYAPERYFALLEQLPEPVLADLAANNAYWAQFESKAAEVTERVYDAMLRSYGQSLGVQSYGAVVDLLIAYAQTVGF